MSPRCTLLIRLDNPTDIVLTLVLLLPPFNDSVKNMVDACVYTDDTEQLSIAACTYQPIVLNRYIFVDKMY